MGAITTILSTLFGGGADKLVAAAGNLFTTDKERLQLENDAYRAETERITQFTNIDAIQAQTNLEEVKRGFGWRTALGWTMVAAMATYFIPKYFITAGFWCWSMYTTGHFVEYPGSVSELYEVLWPMLGFGFLKSGEKVLGKRK